MQKIKKTTIRILLSILFIVSFFVLGNISMENGLEKNLQEIINSEFDGVIDKVYMTRTGEFIHVNHKKYKFFSCANNNGVRFAEVAKKGDYVTKVSGNDYLILNTQLQQFKLICENEKSS